MLPTVHYIWVKQGLIVAAADRLDHQGLASMIEQSQWVSDRVFDKLVHWCCPINEPFGLWLKNQGVLKSYQLKRLFTDQILHQICPLFQLKDGSFTFESNVLAPQREITGLSLPATAAILMGLRVLHSWDALEDKLPDPNGILTRLIAGSPNYRLDPLESQIWEYTKEKVSLFAIARLLSLPVAEVQQIAFRLCAVGLALIQENQHHPSVPKLNAKQHSYPAKSLPVPSPYSGKIKTPYRFKNILNHALQTGVA